MLKRFMLGASFLLLLGIGLWYIGFKDLFLDKNSTISLADLPLTKQESTKDSEAKNNALNLAFKNIDLFQAEKNGFTLWRLRATWANMEEVNGIIKVEAPSLLYYLEDKSTVQVVSQLGELEQSQKILRFIQDVEVTNAENKIQGELLIYENEVMTMPKGGLFHGRGMNGKADFISWSMSKQTITAEGNVFVEFEAS